MTSTESIPTTAETHPVTDLIQKLHLEPTGSVVATLTQWCRDWGLLAPEPVAPEPEATVPNVEGTSSDARITALETSVAGIAESLGTVVGWIKAQGATEAAPAGG